MKPRADVQRALRDWRLLYPPLEKERPTGESGPGKEKNTGNCETEFTPTVEDQQREVMALDAYLLFCHSRDTETRRSQLTLMNGLILARSHAVILQMERERGLS